MDKYYKYNELSVISIIDELKEQVDALRPISKEQEGRIMQKFRLDWNYHSNAIEGNTLDYGETVAFLMHGITAKGKPFKDYLDIKGHDTAISYLEGFVKSNEVLTEKDIRSLHEIILIEPYKTEAVTQSGVAVQKTIQVGTYKSQPNHVITITGETHYYASPEETPAMMGDLLAWYRDEVEKKKLHPILLAALFHHKFVHIHPFDDGNGRMSRLLMNLILMQNGFPPAIIKQDKSSRNEYYLALSEADTGKVLPFIEFIAQREVESLELYLKGALGEDINEPDDLDKEIVLFRKNLEGRADKIEVKRSVESQKAIYKNSLKPFIDGVNTFFKKIADMFLTYEVKAVSYTRIDNDFYFFYKKFTLDESNPNSPQPYLSGENQDYVNDDWLEYLIHTNSLNSSDGIPEVTVAFRLNEFRLAENPFGLELKCSFIFEEYKYGIKYRISDYGELDGREWGKFFFTSNRTSIHKPYHQETSNQEIKATIDKIGKEVLGYMKYRNDEPNAEKNELSKLDWRELWLAFLETTSAFTKNELSTYCPTPTGGAVIEFTISNPEDKLFVKSHLKDFYNYVVKHHKVDKGILFQVEAELPF